MSGIPSAPTSRVRASYPLKQPTTPPAAPSTAPRSASCPPPLATHAPVNPPITIRAIRPGGAVRFGVFGSLSATNSTAASSVKIATAGSEPMRASGPWSFSQPRWTAHAVAAGAVSERNPAKNPMKKAKSSVIMQSSSRPSIYSSAASLTSARSSLVFAPASSVCKQKFGRNSPTKQYADRIVTNFFIALVYPGHSAMPNDFTSTFLWGLATTQAE